MAIISVWSRFTNTLNCTSTHARAHRHSEILMSISFRIWFWEILVSTFCEGLEQFVGDAFGFNVARIACRHFMRRVTHSSALRFLYVYVLRYTLREFRFYFFAFVFPNSNATLVHLTSCPNCYGASYFVFIS